MSEVIKKRLQREIILIIGLTVALVAAYIVLDTIDASQGIVTEWSSAIYGILGE